MARKKRSKYRTYSFTPQNPDKYKGETIPVLLKSSWELEFAQHCDLLPSVISWSYESRQIPYRDPLTGKQKIYIPDFFVEIARRDGHTEHHIFEIKPMHEQLQEHARNQNDSGIIARNAAKWGAATQWADRHSATFSVLNEKDIYGWHESRKPRVNPVRGFAQTHATKPSAEPKKVPRVKQTTKPKPRSRPNSGIKRMQSRLSKVQSARASKAGRVKKI